MVKRRTSAKAGDLPPAKRHVANAPSHNAKLKETAEIYAAYDALRRPADGTAEGHFTSLLNAAMGSPTAQRLVASLLPQFGHHYPQRLQETVSVLTGLATLSVSDANLKPTRVEAVKGLGVLVQNLPVEQHSSVLPSAMRFAVRNLQQRTASNGWVETDGLDAGLAHDGDDDEETDKAIKAEMWTILRNSFQTSPSEALKACIQTLKEPSTDAHAVVLDFFKDHVLAPSPPEVSNTAEGDFLIENNDGTQVSGERYLESLSKEDKSALAKELASCLNELSSQDAAGYIRQLLMLVTCSKPPEAPPAVQEVPGEKRQSPGVKRKERLWSPIDKEHYESNRSEPPPLPAEQELAADTRLEDRPPLPPPEYNAVPNGRRRRSPDSDKEEGEMDLEEGEERELLPPSPRGPSRPRNDDIPDFATCTLWVGHVPKGAAAEGDVLDEFSRYGELASHRFMRGTACAFIDYRSIRDATEARYAIDGLQIAGSVLKVQFKDENHRRGGSPGRGRGRGGGRGGRGRGGGYWRHDDSPGPPRGRFMGRGRRRSMSRSPPPRGYGGGSRGFDHHYQRGGPSEGRASPTYDNDSPRRPPRRP